MNRKLQIFAVYGPGSLIQLSQIIPNPNSTMSRDDEYSAEYDQGDAVEAGRSGSQPLGKIAAHTPMELASGFVAVLAVGSSVTAMILNFSVLTLIGGLACSGVGSYSYYQQTKLTDIIALKEAHEAITRECDRLTAENVRLNETLGDLSNTVDKLEDVEQALDVITQTQGQSVATFAEQVKENENIFHQMEKNLRANVLQNLLQVVIRSDQDDNMTIEEDEIDDLVDRIQKINGVEVVEERFKEAIMESGGSLSSVMDIIKNLMTGESTGDDIFIIKDRKTVCR